MVPVVDPACGVGVGHAVACGGVGGGRGIGGGLWWCRIRRAEVFREDDGAWDPLSGFGWTALMNLRV